ncbi:MAG: sigma-54-dependent transcriptional regulator [Campylobacterota bacterium]
MDIIVVDDQEEIRYSVSKILREYDHRVFTFDGSEQDLADVILAKDPALLLLDVKLGTVSGIDILSQLKDTDTMLPIVLMTAYTTPTNIIEATKLGVRDVLQKPFEAQYLIDIVNRYVSQSAGENIELKIDTTGESFIGSYSTMGEIYKKIGMVASNDLNVMVHGETGTGKELVAKLLHAHSNRKKRPFITINCAAIPSELFEGEFFGYEKGSFTGAQNRHTGYLESADGGIVFLDEVGEMPLFMQSKLLRFLETKTIKRLGSTNEIALDVKIISATNIDIHRAIKQEEFRQDLYYRLSALYLQLPPLRERRDDITLLVSHFIKEANKQLDTRVKSISGQALELLKEHEWIGNVRELKNVITNAVLHTNSENIDKEDLRLSAGVCQPQTQTLESMIYARLNEHGVKYAGKLIKELEHIVTEQTLQICDNNITKAARALNIARNTLKSRLEE